MYIEIGHRQTGKTTRLLKSVKMFLEINPTAKINIVANKGKINQQRFDEANLTEEQKNNIIISHKMIKENNTINFVDEFDFIKEENLFIDDNAYYFSTLKETVNEMGVKSMGSVFSRSLLIHYNEGRIEEHFHFLKFLKPLVD